MVPESAGRKRIKMGRRGSLCRRVRFSVRGVLTLRALSLWPTDGGGVLLGAIYAKGTPMKIQLRFRSAVHTDHKQSIS